MTRSERDKTWAMNTIEDEHVRIRASVTVIKSMLTLLCSSQASELQYKKLNSCLQKFYYELRSHFFNEESKGALIDIVEEFPEVMKAQVKFNREHKQFLDRIRTLRKWAMRAEVSNNHAFKEISQEFESFCDNIVDHDQRETEAFQAVYYTEIGVGD